MLTISASKLAALGLRIDLLDTGDIFIGGNNPDAYDPIHAIVNDGPLTSPTAQDVFMAGAIKAWTQACIIEACE